MIIHIDNITVETEGNTLLIFQDGNKLELNAKEARQLRDAIRLVEPEL